MTDERERLLPARRDGGSRERVWVARRGTVARRGEAPQVALAGVLVAF